MEHRQGCPLSPIIFSLTIEPLAEIIRDSSQVKGLCIRQYEHKIGLFADIILSLSDPASSLIEVQHIIGKFGKVSYYKINASKCYVLSMGIPLDAILPKKQIWL